ncbi:hypothetical protein BDN67DRAFT_324483 [Paxillus ammoniavirescens]|nr:hypothetical protein BDN67DRAFT_324483 [Paxillus ammoniavirescens]
MTSDVPLPKQDGTKGHRFHDRVACISPTQAIAEAWQRESMQSQEFWRQAEARRKEQYSAPRSPPRPRNPSGKM